jgi:hypothetical protein
MARQNSTNQGRTRDELQQLRGGPGGDPGQRSAPLGYQDASGVDRVAQGDDDGPYIKTPPFPEVPVTWTNFTLIKQTYTQLPLIDVQSARTIWLWIDYVNPPDSVSGDGNGILSLLPFGFTDVNKPASSLAVIDPTLSAVSLPDALYPGAYGSRTFYQTELRTPAPGAGLGQIMRLNVAFDIAGYNWFTVAVCDLFEDDSTLALAYNLAQ